MEVQQLVAEAVDVRNLRIQPDEKSGTLSAKESGSYSLNYTNPVIVPDIAGVLQPIGGGPDDNDARAGHIIVFKPSHYTREKDGAPSEIAPPLSADADKGDQDPVLLVRTVGDFGDPQVTIEEGGKPMLAANPMSDRQMVVAVPEVAAALNPGHEGKHSYAGDGGTMNLVSGMIVRRLTPMECERLQAFPDGWTERDADGRPVSDSTRYRMLGNAVCVSVAEWIGRRMLEVHGGRG
jgi:site-specific DNA-cytosine methylase